MPRRPRVKLYDPHNQARAQRLAAMTPEQRVIHRAKEKRQALEPVACAPVRGNPAAIDWESHNCGYVPRIGTNGKVLPKTREPAWQWTEEKGTAGRPYLRSAVQDLALKVYRIGYRHSEVELTQDNGGFPDDLYWGPHGPKLIIRELKPMRPQWKRGQKQHLLSLREADQDVGVWFPCCLLSGWIDEEMASLAGVAPKGTYARRQRGVPNKPVTWEDVAKGALSNFD